ncbi:hypothetical protein NDU88_006202 [Pleurodeles waltl]|uniref:Uncharacterized protein n=1 Tax=Pleurodeles waltl TaxID=8319 RepID=A0AAV7UKA8_PLEWA|nr:hypothetical protein NDU88_006202 [Pleurodeles waltl]
MYHPPHYNPPIHQLFWGGTNAIKSTAETVFGRESTHLSTLNEEPGHHGARAAGPADAGLPPHLPGTLKTAATKMKVCLADQYISHVNAKDPGSVHDSFILKNGSIPYVMAQLQRYRLWLIGVQDHRCMLHNMALRRQVPFVQEDVLGDGLVAGEEPVDSEEEEADEEDVDNKGNKIQQYFQ